MRAAASAFLFGTALFLAGHVAAARAYPYGLWVEAEGPNRTLDDLGRLEKMVLAASEAGITHLYLQVYRGGRSWYASTLADDEPYRQAVTRQGYDPLQFALGLAHARGLQVHAWMNLFNLGRRRDGPLQTRLGSAAVTRDNRGRSLLHYDNSRAPGDEKQAMVLDTPGYWLDPGDPQVQEALAAIIQELVSRYPTLDGVHLDYVRYPYAVPTVPGSRYSNGLDFGYGERSVARFLTETGLSAFAAKGDPAVAQRWDDWRREQLGRFLRQVRDRVRRLRRNLMLSAALLAWPDRAYQSAYQDWRLWLEEGLLDHGIIMNYNRDSHLARHLSRQAVAFRGHSKLFVGLGAYVFLDQPDLLAQQIRDAREQGADGVVLFSYDNLLKREGFLDQLSAILKR
ncbi:MAG: glycoside hydrolase family 10 protein [Candidatus Methylomirabilis sp.]